MCDASKSRLTFCRRRLSIDLNEQKVNFRILNVQIIKLVQFVNNTFCIWCPKFNAVLVIKRSIKFGTTDRDKILWVFIKWPIEIVKSMQCVRLVLIWFFGLLCIVIKSTKAFQTWTVKKRGLVNRSISWNGSKTHLALWLTDTTHHLKTHWNVIFQLNFIADTFNTKPYRCQTLFHIYSLVKQSNQIHTSKIGVAETHRHTHPRRNAFNSIWYRLIWCAFCELH